MVDETTESEVGVLSFAKDVDDIEKPVLLPADYYLFRVHEKPTVQDNAAQKALKKGEEPQSGKEPGQNWVVPLRSISEEPELNGRMFTAYLPLPTAEDTHAYDARGQKKYDAKMDRIVKFVLGFGGTAQGQNVFLPKGAIGGLRVDQIVDKVSKELVNNLNIFAGVKTAEEMGVDLEALAAAVGEDDTPF
jgi:hypothetical protein